MLFMGPASFFGNLITPSRTLILLSAFFLGLAYAFSIVSSFARTNMAALELGYPNNINTYLITSGED